MVTLREEDELLQNPALRAVLDNHGLLTPDGALKQSDVAFQSQGVGPIIDPAVIEKFMELDTTRNLKVLDWMLFAAGGGAPALQESQTHYDAAKERWIGERMQGRGDEGAPIEPMSREQAEAGWLEVEATFRNAFFPADGDVLSYFEYKVFGYERYWPGAHNRYADVYDNTKTFLENMVARHGGQSKISIINQARQRRAEEAGGTYVPIMTELSKYETVDDLKKINDEFYYFFRKRKAAKDVQFVGKGPEGYTRGPGVTFYDDHNCVAYIPATAAAMMKVGFDNWCVANRTAFDKAFHHDPRQRQIAHWTNYQQNGPLCVIQFKGNVEEPDRPQGHEWHGSLKRLAVYLNRDLCRLPDLKEPYEGLQFFDRENRYTPRPVDWPELADRLDRLENKTVKNSVKNVVDAFIQWAAQTKGDEIKVSVYEAFAMQLVWRMLNSQNTLLTD